MTRRILREHTFKLLFLSIFRMPEEMDEQIELYRQEYALEGEDAAYVIGKVKDILNFNYTFTVKYDIILL